MKLKYGSHCSLNLGWATSPSPSPSSKHCVLRSRLYHGTRSCVSSKEFVLSSTTLDELTVSQSLQSCIYLVPKFMVVVWRLSASVALCCCCVFVEFWCFLSVMWMSTRELTVGFGNVAWGDKFWMWTSPVILMLCSLSCLCFEEQEIERWPNN